ncbi:MAG TPA: cation diffusion facilitator family transporter [Candidatus Humimicrobiaceae bacterium]|nr:cation diffusion facilitator family transporter [Candidatus Humimicrobiaceae bacterium]
MKEKIAIISILANMVLAGGKIIVGVFSGSSAILAEGIHSFMDIFSSAIGYIGIKISKKPSDQKHPYGHYKFEVLAGFFITLILLGTGVGIIYEAYQKFLNPSSIKIPVLAFSVMIFSALINEIMARLKIHFGKKENSMALLSDGFHSRVDVFTSLAVFAGLFLTRYWIYTDSVLAFLIGLYIVKQSFALGKEAVDSLLDVSAGEKIEEKIRTISKKENIEISSLKTQKKGSAVTANLEIKLPNNLKVEEATKISNNLREKLMKEIESLQYVAIQITSHEVETGFYKPSFGQGFGWQRRGRFKGELEKAAGEGPGGYCVCPECDYKIPHERGVPCSTLECPNCKIKLIRK